MRRIAGCLQRRSRMRALRTVFLMGPGCWSDLNTEEAARTSKSTHQRPSPKGRAYTLGRIVSPGVHESGCRESTLRTSLGHRFAGIERHLVPVIRIFRSSSKQSDDTSFLVNNYKPPPTIGNETALDTCDTISDSPSIPLLDLESLCLHPLQRPITFLYPILPDADVRAPSDRERACCHRRLQHAGAGDMSTG